MGGHHIEVPKVPDWRIYRVQDAPELHAFAKALEQHGLRDPWLRNEVWKYTEGAHALKKTARMFFTRGMKPGIAAGIITGVLELIFLPVQHKYDEIHEGPTHH